MLSNGIGVAVGLGVGVGVGSSFWQEIVRNAAATMAEMINKTLFIKMNINNLEFELYTKVCILQDAQAEYGCAAYAFNS